MTPRYRPVELLMGGSRCKVRWGSRSSCTKANQLIV